MRSDVVRSSRVRGVNLGSILRHYVVVIHSQKSNLNPRKSALSVPCYSSVTPKINHRRGFTVPTRYSSASLYCYSLWDKVVSPKIAFQHYIVAIDFLTASMYELSKVTTWLFLREDRC